MPFLVIANLFVMAIAYAKLILLQKCLEIKMTTKN